MTASDPAGRLSGVAGRIAVAVLATVVIAAGSWTQSADAESQPFAGSCTVILALDRQPHQITVTTPKPGNCVFGTAGTELRVGTVAIDGSVVPRIPGVPFDCLDSHGVGSATADVTVHDPDGSITQTRSDLRFGLELIAGAGVLSLSAGASPPTFHAAGPTLELPPFSETCDVAGNALQIFGVVELAFQAAG